MLEVDKLWAEASQDIYFTPGYLQLFKDTKFGGDVELFVYDEGYNKIFYPYYKRKIPNTNWFDIISPYGYSGPIDCVPDLGSYSKIWKNFWVKFGEYCKENKIVSEFARLNPYLKNHIPIEENTEKDPFKRGEVVYIDLYHNDDLIKKGFSKGNKSSISLAKRSGITVEQSTDIETFYKLYTQTMERREAKDEYFFSLEFCEDVLELLGNKATLFIAKHNGEPTAASLFLSCAGITHYFLSGSDCGNLGANNLLLSEAILWAKNMGSRIFDLGGGYGDSGLLNFKKSFSKNTADFYTYSRIHNQEVYDRLCKNKPETDFFPRYRV